MSIPGSVPGKTLNRVVREEQGFTLLELLIAMQIISILLLVAVPSYLQFSDNANQATAKSNAKEVAIAAGLWYQNNSTYAGMTIPLLKGLDGSLTATRTFVNNSGVEAAGVTNRVTLDASHFCTYSVSGRWFAYQLNPGGPITATTDPSAVCS
jgi:prepilin-type N-terminal cleavage/methylation domain-containing protein